MAISGHRAIGVTGDWRRKRQDVGVGGLSSIQTNAMLPFPRAHYWVLVLLVTTFAAFWPSYFMVFADASFAHHLHGITASL